MKDLRGKHVLVVGLARTGRAVARCLLARGARLTVTDSRPPSAFRSELPELMAGRVGVELGLHREATFLRQGLIVVSPGVPPDLPALEAARRHGIPIVEEVEAASWFLKGSVIGVTGSNGKTTTTALLGKILEASGYRTFVAGNIGVPLISVVDRDSPDSLLVTELSSFQLEGIQDLRPHVAVLLNLTPNHLDRHPSFEAYVQAKANIFKNQTPQDYAILNADDPKVIELGAGIASRKIYFSRRQSLRDGVFVSNGDLRYRVGNLERPLLGTREIPLRGDFNVENVLAASAAACVLGADFDAIRKAVCAFKGVEHRLEYVRDVRGVEFFNDSKATSVDATAKALTAFEHGVHLILGGKDKGAPYQPVRALLEGRVRGVYLIGAAAGRIARELSGAADIIPAGELQKAVRLAFERAVSGDTVLLSPACASYDQFQDFEQRGRDFKELVERLAEEVETAESQKRRREPPPGPWVAPSPVVAPARPLEPSPSPPASAGEAVRALMSAEVREMASGEELRSPEAAVKETRAAPPAAGASPFFETAEAELPFEGTPFGVPELPEAISETPEATVQQPAQPSFEGLPQPAGVAVPRELEYVYEVNAEEVASLELDVPNELSGDAEAAPLTMAPPEEVKDEWLPFEIKAASGSSALSGAHSGKTEPDEGGSI